jgi:hypothetical protein
MMPPRDHRANTVWIGGATAIVGTPHSALGIRSQIDYEHT